MTRIIPMISALTLGVGAAVLAAMTLLIVVDVFMRNVLGVGFPATAELVSRYGMVLVTFLPVAYAEAERRHVEVTAVSGRLPGAARRVLFVAGIALSIPIYGLLTWGNGVEAVRNTISGSFVHAGQLRVITWPSLWILPLSYAAMTLVLCLHLAAALTGRLKDEDPMAALEAEAERAAS